LRAKRRPYHKRDEKNRKIPGAVTVSGGNVCPKKFTGKELDPETGLYYFGARYLDPKTSRWLSGDPAVGDYLPSAPVNDDARKHNQNLPGQGGVFNYVNLHVYHYAGNNPVRYVDPDGNDIHTLTEDQWNNYVKREIDAVVANLDSVIQELADFDTGKISSLSPNLISAVNDWLGVGFNLPGVYKELGSRLTKIRDGLSSMTRNDFRYDDFVNNFTYQGATTTFVDNNAIDKTFAYASPFGSRIYLGPRYFNSINSGNDTRQGTLVHEITHKFKVMWLNDRAYGTDRSSNLRANLKSGNADNWQYFYERLFTRGD
jgi:RHS repeat-associated protein